MYVIKDKGREGVLCNLNIIGSLQTLLSLYLSNKFEFFSVYFFPTLKSFGGEDYITPRKGKYGSFPGLRVSSPCLGRRAFRLAVRED